MVLQNKPPQILTKTDLVEHVANIIANWITNHDLQPGDKLPSEKELQNHFGVGRTVVREAISRLRGKNIIAGSQGKGNFVVDEPVETLFSRIRLLYGNDIDKLPYLWEFREILEVRIAGLAAKRRTSQDIHNMKSALADMQKAVEEKRMGIDEDDRFHYYVTKAAHNPIIEQVMIDLSAMIEPSKRIDLERPFRPLETCREISSIFDAINAGDPERSMEAMALHVHNSQGDSMRVPDRFE